MQAFKVGFVFMTAFVFEKSSSSCPAFIPQTNPSFYQSSKTSCYYFSQPGENTSVFKAQSRCRSGGGHLVYIQSREENHFLRYHLAHTYDLRHNDSWIGLKFDPGFGLVWDNGSAVTFNNIHFDDRSKLKDHTFCIAISGHSGSWKINDCLKKFYRPFVGFPQLSFVCEFELK